MNKVFSQLQDETDFENALRKIKLKGKELERLPNERRVGCVTVSIQPMKRGAEGLFQKCYNGICNEMNNKIEKLKSELTEFIQSSSMALDKVIQVATEKCANLKTYLARDIYRRHFETTNQTL